MRYLQLMSARPEFLLAVILLMQPVTIWAQEKDAGQEQEEAALAAFLEALELIGSDDFPGAIAKLEDLRASGEATP